MTDALDLCDLAADGLALFDACALDDDLLRNSVLRLQHHLDRITVIQSQLLSEIERRKAFLGTGARGAADWLAGKSKSSYGSAKKKSRLGKALDANPDLKEAVDKGDVSPDSADALADAVTNRPKNATDDDVKDLIDAVKGADPKEAKEAADLWSQLLSEETEEAAEERRYQARSVRSSQASDGMVTTTVKLPTLESRMFINAISHVAGKPSENDPRTTEQRLADGLIGLADAYAKGQVNGGREKPTIIITIPVDGFTGDSNEPGFTAQGDRIPAHVVRRLAERADLQRVMMAGSHVLDLGRKVRFATDEQFKALLARDGGCRVKNCGIPGAWCDVDHFIDWDHMGATSLEDLWLLCPHHHTEKHRPGVRVEGTVYDARIILADGTVLECRPPKQAAPFVRKKSTPDDPPAPPGEAAA
jgi:hypothetical protein